ncbi:MAG: CAP domain-containing protein [Oscillospiraceae bacterium]|nr:CAP domain-containing protein [Oscillospiraceae bacterium]
MQKENKLSVRLASLLLSLAFLIMTMVSLQIVVLATESEPEPESDSTPEISIADYEFTISSALLILRALVGLEELTDAQKFLYDVDGNGWIDINDALQVLRYLVGLPSVLDDRELPTSELTPSPEIPELENLTELATEVVRLANIERENRGLSPFTVASDDMIMAANLRAREITVYFSHTRPNGTSWTTTLIENNIPHTTAGENLAWGQRTPAEVMQGWMNSRGHRENILNPNFGRIAVGAVQYNGRFYWVQLFKNP